MNENASTFFGEVAGSDKGGGFCLLPLDREKAFTKVRNGSLTPLTELPETAQLAPETVSRFHSHSFFLKPHVNTLLNSGFGRALGDLSPFASGPFCFR